MKTLKWTLRIFIHIFVIWLALFIMLQWFEDKIIFHPPKRLLELPSERGVGFADAFIKTEDGITIHAWWIPAKAPDSAEKADFKNAPTILEFHGNAENISYGMDQHITFHSMGYNLLVVDYRGYGRSEGKPSEKGIYLDGEASYHYLVNALGVPEDSLFIYGRSIGGAVAVHIAEKFPPAGLITEGLFTDSHDVARDILPWIIPHIFIKKKFDSISKIKNIGAPKLFLHAAEDEIIPPYHAKRLFETAPEPKFLFWIKGAGHNDAFYVGGEDYCNAISEFIRKYPPEK